MRLRGVTATDIEAVLENQISTWHDPKQSSWVLMGIASAGRTLIVYVPDTDWPPVDSVTIKSVAWR